MEYRFYSFVAHHYLSQLQCGLQTAHAVARMSLDVQSRPSFTQWAAVDQTIIICGAGNHAGVNTCYSQMDTFNSQYPFQLPLVLFHEDEQSMNTMATACGILVPSRFYEAEYDSFLDIWSTAEGESPLSIEEINVITFLKSYRLA